MKKFIQLSIISIFTLTACNTTKDITSDEIEEKAVSTSDQTNTGSAVYWQQNSAEYEALCYQAFNSAQVYLNQFLDGFNPSEEEINNEKKLTIVMDLDETVLNNSTYNGYLVKNNLIYSPETWREWTMQASADLVPGALEFINGATDAGIEIFFISNRSQRELPYTIQNLVEKGVKFSEEKILLSGRDFGSKKQDRRNIIAPSYNIIMLIGDNLADFHEVFESEVIELDQRKQLVNSFQNQFGKKFIILPNVMYGDWMPTEPAENDPNRPVPVKDLNPYIESYK